MPHIETTSLPNSSGVYMFFDRKEALIYVGKAKNIRKRVASYFGKQLSSTGKLKKLVSEICRMEYIITGSEHNALLLENNLIKKSQPRYNILLKDGKTYPYICITKENFPRIISTRKLISGKGEYFGPYTNVVALNNTLDLIRRMLAIRSCKLALSEKNIAKKKFRVCLEYHIGNCKGPCAGLQHADSYEQDIVSARNILSGKFAAAIHYFTKKMDISSADLAFERAAHYKKQRDRLKSFQIDSQVASTHTMDVDIITITSLPKKAFINYMQIKGGSITLSKNVEIIKKIGEPDDDILSYAIHEMRSKYDSPSTLVISNKPISIHAESIKNNVPKKGEKRKLMELSLKNALYYRQLWESQRKDDTAEKNTTLAELKQKLSLQRLPHNIECFDISNFHRDSPVASMVSFIGGKPKRSNYRHYNIKTIEKANDFAAIYEVVWRRYRRLIEEHKDLPDLIIVDGGKGQLSRACEALSKLGLYNKIPIISIAKKLEEIYRPYDSRPLRLDRKSADLLLIQKIRDEAHRFALTFHRLKRGKKTLKIDAKMIAGIGDKTIEKLLKEFKSWKNVKEASSRELEKIIGKHRTHTLIRNFMGEKKVPINEEETKSL